jgi:hypothetical protein
VGAAQPVHRYRAGESGRFGEYDWLGGTGIGGSVVLHAAYADREAARRYRYAAWQAHQRASAMVERLQRRMSEMCGRLGWTP